MKDNHAFIRCFCSLDNTACKYFNAWPYDPYCCQHRLKDECHSDYAFKERLTVERELVIKRLKERSEQKLL